MKFALYSRFQTMIAEVGVEETARFAIAHGLRGVEFYCDAVCDVSAIPTVEAAKETRRVLDAYGLPMVCVSTAYDAVLRPDAVGTMQKYLEIAAALGSPFMHHTLLISPDKNDTPDDILRKVDIAADKAVAIAHAAKELGLTCIYEDQGRYVNGVARFGRFFNNVKSRAENVGVCADLGNILYADEAPEVFLSAFRADIKHVHVKDYLHKAGINPGMYWKPTQGGAYLRNTMVGHGIVNFAACMDVLKEIGYDGYFALELDHPEPFEDGIAQAISYLTPFYEETKA